MASAIVTQSPTLARWARCAVLLAAAAASTFPPQVAFADDWGCQVLLCLSDPRGPESEQECVPPIEKLWSALRHGKPFPSCDFNSSQNDLPADVRNAIPASALANLGAGSGATNVGAGASYCREDMLSWGGPEQSQLVCGASGAINVMVNGQLFTRVWWDAGGQGSTVTEYYGTPMAGIPATTPYDPTQAAQQFMQLQNQNANQSGGGG